MPRRCRLHGGDENRPGVGDHDVDLSGLPDRRDDAVGVGDVQPEPLVHRQAGQRARVRCGGDHPVAAPSQLGGGGPADPLGGAGNQDRGHGSWASFLQVAST